VADAQRNPYLDGLRFVAALAVVMQHSTLPWIEQPLAAGINGAFRWGVPVFFLVSGFLHPADADRAWVKRRFCRLVVPYAFWTIAWLLYILVTSRSVVVLRGGMPLWELQVIFFGAAGPLLWFLPALLYVGALATLPKTSGQRALAAALGVGSYLLLPLLKVPSVGSADYFTALGLYLALYLVGVEAARRRVAIPGPGWAHVACGAAILVALGVTGATQGLWAPSVTWGGLAFAVLMFLSAVKGALPVRSLAWGGPLLMGVYQLHFLLLRVIWDRYPLPGHSMVKGLPALFTVLAVASIGLSMLAQKSRLLRRVFG